MYFICLLEMRERRTHYFRWFEFFLSAVIPLQRSSAHRVLRLFDLDVPDGRHLNQAFDFLTASHDEAITGRKQYNRRCTYR